LANLTFWGGVGSVTGSMHVLQVNGFRLLIDCGFYQGRRQEARRRNETFPFNPSDIDALVLSHAHIDHSGNIPNLVKQGFDGTVYATSATRDLCAAMLKDSANIQRHDARYITKVHKERGLPPVEPLYTVDDVDESLRHFIGVPYHRPVHLSDDIQLTFQDAGHVLGSALTALDIRNGGDSIRLAYVVDLGRKHLPILRDPEPIKDADITIMESTYGGRLHDPMSEAEKRLADVIIRTHARKGKVIIPSFALERTQEILYCIRRLLDKKAIPQIAVYVDSPLATRITEVFRLHTELFDNEMGTMLAQGEDPFDFSTLTYIRNVTESKELNDDARPMIIISASGMCESGRVVHHLVHTVEDKRNTVLIVGFQAKDTLGRKIAEHHPEVRILGDSFKLKAEVVIIDAFSAHADQNGLLDYVRKTKKRCKLYLLVHGEEDQATDLADAMVKREGVQASIAKRGGSVELFLPLDQTNPHP
jgi:metallo-beta-lactamase family protein